MSKDVTAISKRMKELQLVREQLAFILTIPKEKETHPGGIRLGLSDWMMEEVMLLQEISKLTEGENMPSEQETKLYFEARNRALERLVHEPPLIDQAEKGFKTGLRVAIAGLRGTEEEQIKFVTDIIKSEDNFSFGFICGVLCRLEAVKGKSYQASWQKRGEEDGVMVNVERKYDRLDATVRHGATGETKSQVLGDLAVYAMKWLPLRAELNPREFLNWLNEVRSF